MSYSFCLSPFALKLASPPRRRVRIDASPSKNIRLSEQLPAVEETVESERARVDSFQRRMRSSGGHSSVTQDQSIGRKVLIVEESSQVAEDGVVEPKRRPNRRGVRAGRKVRDADGNKRPSAVKRSSSRHSNRVDVPPRETNHENLQTHSSSRQ